MIIRYYNNNIEFFLFKNKYINIYYHNLTLYIKNFFNLIYSLFL